MKRIRLLLTLAAVVGAMVAISAGGAAADPVCEVAGPDPMALFTETCVETTTTTVERTEAATPQACVVGRSDRTGTQEGTRTNTYQVTTTTTTVKVYQSVPQPWKTPLSTSVDTDTSEVLIDEGDFTLTGPCKPTPPGPQ